jgi:proline racemase
VSRADLEARYRALVLQELPDRAREGRWVITADHCFGRIVLDHAVGGRWYDVLDRRRSPAFAQLSDEQLAGAVALAERVLAEGDPLLRALDAQSLAWRGKPPEPATTRR